MVKIIGYGIKDIIMCHIKLSPYFNDIYLTLSTWICHLKSVTQTKSLYSRKKHFSLKKSCFNFWKKTRFTYVIPGTSKKSSYLDSENNSASKNHSHFKDRLWDKDSSQLEFPEMSTDPKSLTLLWQNSLINLHRKVSKGTVKNLWELEK